MNKILKSKSILKVFLIAAITFSCSTDDNEDIAIPPSGATFDAELFVSEEGGDMRSVTVSADGSTGAEITSKVAFKTITNNMRRLYITEEVNGGAPEPFVFTSQEVDEKPDGSLDLVGDDKKDFEFQINLPAPMAEGESIVYTFWATTGRGDFRDVSKRNAIDATALGTITVNYGTPTIGSGINEFTTIILAAPLADGTSETFLSLYNSTVYKISEGEETAALWDFGYYYGASGLASLASTRDYPDSVINVPTISGVADAELNEAFFSLSTTTSAEFDAIALSSDLDFIAASTNQRVTTLNTGDIVEIVDNYGKKGLIRVDAITPGNGTDGQITLTIKIQL